VGGREGGREREGRRDRKKYKVKIIHCSLHFICGIFYFKPHNCVSKLSINVSCSNIV